MVHAAITSPPTAHDAALAQAVQAVADSVRASYKPPEELLVDPTTIRAVADAAATTAEAAARDAFTNFLRPLLQAPAAGELVDTSSTLADPMTAPLPPATDAPPSSLTLSAADLVAVVAQLGALSTAPGRLPPPLSAVLPAPPPVGVFL
uniref:Uncharacterized protein n=1 Tax=Oryza glumipatula TaxID=40148 RepID=A0A0E0B079_9ORYZ